jgi:hypothetical protein
MAWINEAMQGEASTPARSPKVITHGIRARRPTELDPLLVALQSYAYHNCLVSYALDCHQLLLVPPPPPSRRSASVTASSSYHSPMSHASSPLPPNCSTPSHRVGPRLPRPHAVGEPPPPSPLISLLRRCMPPWPSPSLPDLGSLQGRATPLTGLHLLEATTSVVAPSHRHPLTRLEQPPTQESIVAIIYALWECITLLEVVIWNN